MARKALLVLIGATLLAAGCAGPERDSAVSIAFIPKNTGNPYFDGIVEGFRAGCEQIGCAFTTVGPATAGATAQIPFITAQAQRGVDVIAISPNSPDALNPTFDRVRRRGSLVLSINSDMPGNEKHRDAAILPVDFAKVGASQVELIGSLIGYQGQIAVLSATTDAPDQNQWIADMRRTLESDPKYARMKLVAVVYGDDDPQKSTTEAEALLANYPDLVGVVSPTTVGLAAAAQVVETTGRAGRVHVTGLGTPNQMRRFVHNGTVTAFQLWSPYQEGLLAAHFAVGVKQGTIQNSPGASFEVPGLGAVKVLDDNVIHTQAELTTFDRANIDDFKF